MRFRLHIGFLRKAGRFFLLLFLGTGNFVFSQSDSSLSPIDFFESIAKFHPFVKQAGLNLDLAKQEILMTRGQFDPKLLSRFNQKMFDSKDYYNLFNTELKVATWPGIDVKAGFERNAGIYVNEEETTPSGGLQYLGVSVPLGQGLFTDARRITVKQARLGLRMADAERQKQVNKVLYSAAKDYWDWFFCYQQLKNAELAYSLASERYKAVQVRILVGDQAPIDSVEAFIFQQDRQVFLQQSRYEELNSRLQLSTYFWDEGEQPKDIPMGTLPEIPAAYLSRISDSSSSRLMQLAAQNHPELLKINIKTDLLKLDQKLGKEMLKPMLNVNYNWLSRTDQSVWAPNTLNRNYKFGFDFSFPLLLRKERGKLGLIKTKLMQNSMDQVQFKRDIAISIQTSFNDLKNLESLIVLQSQMVENYQKLRNAEIRKFENGESSLFLINSREAKLIEALIKQASLVAKFQKQRTTMLYSAGSNPLLPIP